MKKIWKKYEKILELSLANIGVINTGNLGISINGERSSNRRPPQNRQNPQNTENDTTEKDESEDDSGEKYKDEYAGFLIYPKLNTVLKNDLNPKEFKKLNQNDNLPRPSDLTKRDSSEKALIFRFKQPPGGATAQSSFSHYKIHFRHPTNNNFDFARYISKAEFEKKYSYILENFLNFAKSFLIFLECSRKFKKN